MLCMFCLVCICVNNPLIWLVSACHRLLRCIRVGPWKGFVVDLIWSTKLRISIFSGNLSPFLIGYTPNIFIYEQPPGIKSVLIINPIFNTSILKVNSDPYLLWSEHNLKLGWGCLFLQKFTRPFFPLWLQLHNGTALLLQKAISECEGSFH